MTTLPRCAEQGQGGVPADGSVRAATAAHGGLGELSGERGTRAGDWKDPLTRPVGGYGTLLNRRRVILGSIAAELSTFREKAGATRTPRTLSAGTPLDSH